MIQSYDQFNVGDQVIVMIDLAGRLRPKPTEEVDDGPKLSTAALVLWALALVSGFVCAGMHPYRRLWVSRHAGRHSLARQADHDVY